MRKLQILVIKRVRALGSGPHTLPNFSGSSFPQEVSLALHVTRCKITTYQEFAFVSIFMRSEDVYKFVLSMPVIQCVAKVEFVNYYKPLLLNRNTFPG